MLRDVTFKEVGLVVVIGLMVGVYLTYISPLVSPLVILVIGVTMSLAG
jgi:hypothetical protein